MNPCEEYRSAIHELVFEDPEDQVGLSVHEHLAACAACREEERRLLELRDAVHGADPAPSPALRARLRAALPAERPSPAAAWWRRPVPVWATAAACAVIAALALAMPRLGQTWTASRTTAPSESANFVLPGAPPPFTIAGSFDTGVCIGGPVESTRVVFPRARDRDRDSL
jgi:anti-sigma factor RsiW